MSNGVMISQRSVSFFIPGLAKTAGSKRAFVITPKGGGRPRAIVTDDCAASKDWKADVKQFASQAINEPFDGPVLLVLTFVMPRPAGHFGAGKNSGKLRGGSPAFPEKRPDVLKLARAVEDGLTGVAWNDDAQIVSEILHKRFVGILCGNKPGVLVEIESLLENEPAP